MTTEPEILFEHRGAAGVVTLNRAQALNAVTLGMVRALALQLAAWAADPAVTRIVICGAGERAFSAGGDLRALYEFITASRFEEAATYWREEYVLNAAIKHCRKPYVALIDGIVMGGGAGVSVHGSHRVAGDKFRFAMPEASIGFFPDVGATWFLPRLPGEIGAYCALTGNQLGIADAVACGVATHRVRSAQFPDLRDALCGTVPVDAVLNAFAEPRGEGPIAGHRAAIDRLFAGDTVEGILIALDRAAAENGPGAAFARDAAATIRINSPTSLKIALAQVRRGKSMSFEECMQTEYRIVSRIMREHDLREGIRAAIIDKDRAPKWSPADLAAVAGKDVERYFAPVADELALS